MAGERVEVGAVLTSRMAGGSGGGVGKAGEGERGPVSSSSVEMVELQSEATVRLDSGRPKSINQSITFMVLYHMYPNQI